jgi:hypothetical protein
MKNQYLRGNRNNNMNMLSDVEYIGDCYRIMTMSATRNKDFPAEDICMKMIKIISLVVGTDFPFQKNCS